MKFDYIMPPPLIRNETPIQAIHSGILLNINLLAVNLINHEDDLVPGTMLPVPILNDWDTCTHDIENDTATSIMLTTTSTCTPLRRHEMMLLEPRKKNKYAIVSNISTFKMKLTLRHQHSSNPLTMEVACYNNKQIQYPYPLLPTLNSWGAKLESNSDNKEYVSSIPTKSTTLSLIHTRRLLFKSMPDSWSMKTVEEPTPTTTTPYQEWPTSCSDLGGYHTSSKDEGNYWSKERWTEEEEEEEEMNMDSSDTEERAYGHYTQSILQIQTQEGLVTNRCCWATKF
jgi:hypothetical protein